jgi:hypothetical protein
MLRRTQRIKDFRKRVESKRQTLCARASSRRPRPNATACLFGRREHPPQSANGQRKRAHNGNQGCQIHGTRSFLLQSLSNHSAVGGGVTTDGAHSAFVVQRGHGMRRAALRHQIARAALASAATSGHAQLKLNVIKAHANMGMAHDLAIGHSVAHTDNHGLVVSIRKRMA